MTDKNKKRILAEKQVLTTGEAAELCRVSQQTIIRCFDSGQLKGLRVPGSRFRVPGSKSRVSGFTPSRGVVRCRI